MSVIPLVLLVGFLGAGKTRFLTEVIPELHARGLRPRVILNDFMNATIDAARLAQLDALVTPLNGECVCCTSLRELMDTLHAVTGSAGDVMLIEANGATEADELLGYLSMDQRLAQFTLPVQITVVDASRWQRRWWHNALEAAQTRTATHIVLNWTHRLKAPRLAAVEASIRIVNARATLTTPARFADTLAELSASPRASRMRATRSRTAGDVTGRESGSTSAHTHPFASATFALPSLVNRVAFLSFVRSLPPSVVRAKGMVRFSDRPTEMFVWNRIEGRKQVLLDRSWPHADATPVALFIGVELPLAELEDQLQRVGEEI